MSIDISAEYGYGVVLSSEEFKKVKKEATTYGMDEYGEFENFPFEDYFVRIDNYRDETEYFFGIPILSAYAGYADTDVREMAEDEVAELSKKLEEINKILGTNYKAAPCVYCLLW